MSDKNDTYDSASEARLEHHVDEMMDPKLPDSPGSHNDPEISGAPELRSLPDSPNDEPEIDIFKDQNDAEIPVHEPPAEEKIAEQPIGADQSDADVDDIVAHEGDELLVAQDAEVGQAFAGQQTSLGDRLKAFIMNWWDNRPLRYGTIGLLLVAVGVAGVIPTSRYVVLNSVGVRSTASLTILDSTTTLPLKNVDVTVGHATGKTNDDGLIQLHGLKLGSQKMTIEQLGFATVSKTVVVGLGSNPLGDVSLKAVGAQYRFIMTDFLSGNPVGSAEANAGDANAQADDKGMIVLTVGGLNPAAHFTVLLSASGYRQEKVTVDANTKTPMPVAMVTTRKELFVSKQSGKYDLYRMDIDGKNKQLLLAGTGIERPQMTLVSHPTDDVVALVSSRENNRNQDGYLLDTLSLINVSNGAVLSLDQSEQIKIVDWTNDKLIYVKVKAGTSAGNAERYQLMSYDYSTTKRLQLAAANTFADIVSAKGVLYYATGNYYQPGQSQFARVNPDNTGRQVLLNAQVWNILRSSYNDLNLAGGYEGNTQDWYSYHLGDSSAKKLATAPADVNTSRYYLDAADGKRALWTEVRDGKGVLIVYDDTSHKDTVLVTQSGLASPLRWLDSRTVIYRVVTPGETADYAVSLDGGSPRKLTDVTNVAGLGQWNYGY